MAHASDRGGTHALPALPLERLRPEGAPRPIGATFGVAPAITGAATGKTPSLNPPGRSSGALSTATAASNGSRPSLVGRGRELDQLRACVDAALAGRGQLALISGKPGSGKSALAVVCRAEAEARGASVVWSRCRSSASPYAPWFQALRSLGPGRHGAVAADVAQLAAMQAGQRPDVSLVEAVCRLLSRCSPPAVVILDDIDCADPESLALLGLLAPLVADIPTLVIATHGERRIGSRRDLASALAQMPKDTVRLPLRGLADEEVGRVLALIAGPCSPRLAAEVRRETAGNPWQVVETARLLLAEGLIGEGRSGDDACDGQLPVPQSLKDTVAGVIGQLSETSQELLSTAAILGSPSPLSVLEVATGLHPQRLLAAIEEVLGTELFDVVPSPTAYAFSSPIVGRAVYESMTPTERSLRHHHVGEALDRLPSGVHRPPADVLAYHLLQGAAASGDVHKAIAYAWLAGDEANAARRHREAADHYEAGLDLLGDHRLGERCELLLCLGDVHSKMGQLARARETFEGAVRLSREHGTPSQFARAVLGVGGRLVRLDAFFDADLVRLLEEALDRIGPGDSGMRATLLARLSRALFCGGDLDRRAGLSAASLEMARRVGDREAQMAALHSRYWVLTRPEELPERLAVANQLLLLAEDAGDPEMALQGHHWRLLQLAEIGDMRSAAADVHSYTKLANRLRQPLYVWFSHLLQGMLALSDGRFSDAEHHAHEARRLGQETGNPFSARYFEAQLFWIRCQQWRFDQLPDDEEEQIFTRTTMARTRRAFRYALADERLNSRVDFDALAQHSFADVPYDATWMALMVLLAQTSSYLRDAPRAEQLYAALLPYANRNIVIGAALACDGAVSHYLAVLAAVSCRWDVAVVHFEHALAFNHDIGAEPCAARTAYEFARVLLQRGADGDAARAAALLLTAAERARTLGIEGLAEAADRLQPAEGLGGAEASSEAGPPPPSLDSEAASVCVIHRNADYWTIVFEGTEVVLKHCKGLVYLEHLLRNPNREFHVADLAVLTSPPPAPNQHLPLCDRGGAVAGGPRVAGWPRRDEPLDQEARRGYRQRLLDLEDELAEARRFNDPERAAKAQRETDFLVAELATRYRGHLAGPNWASASEKTRKAVTNRIRAVIMRLTKEHGAVATHLSRTIQTGTFCAYVQEDPRRWLHGTPRSGMVAASSTTAIASGATQ